jgi:hypothetical protein
VHFTPCARTAWDHHTIGQTLYVTEGDTVWGDQLTDDEDPAS